MKRKTKVAAAACGMLLAAPLRLRVPFVQLQQVVDVVNREAARRPLDDASGELPAAETPLPH